KKITKLAHSKLYDIVPDYYHGVTPKLKVRVGDAVKVGTPIFRSKRDEAMNFVAPVSGTVKEIVRGERRKILKIVIEADETLEYVEFNTKSSTKEDIKSALLESGMWTFIKQRPFDIIANPTKEPRDIFISTFDSAPSAPDYEFILKDKLDEFKAGVEAVKKLTTGNVYLGLSSEQSIFNQVEGVKKTIFVGKHPAGNIGVQINHTAPVNKDETVWTINPQDLCLIGRFFKTGKVDFTKTIALTGSEVQQAEYFDVVAGSKIDPIVTGRVNKTEYPLRYVSGNVLTGEKISLEESISPYANQISVLNDGSTTHELLGWAMPRLNKFSVSALFLSKFFKRKTYKWDSRLLGGRRAIIMSNEYDKVFPMDIMPEPLIKAMISRNIDRMESLGVYEIAPEDFALCEFVDTSKLPLQAIVRKSLDDLRSEIE
ncbi:MAG: NADH:ubiquinone reductase (Na(+)-transporting) subunit A, partial [Paludibacter sp.]